MTNQKTKESSGYTFTLLFSIVSSIIAYGFLIEYWPMIALYICYGLVALFFIVLWIIFGLGATGEIIRYIKQLRR